MYVCDRLMNELVDVNTQSTVGMLSFTLVISHIVLSAQLVLCYLYSTAFKDLSVQIVCVHSYAPLVNLRLYLNNN